VALVDTTRQSESNRTPEMPIRLVMHSRNARLGRAGCGVQSINTSNSHHININKRGHEFGPRCHLRDLNLWRMSSILHRHIITMDRLHSREDIMEGLVEDIL